jgi:P27 family predicted phage terminase small subunit
MRPRGPAPTPTHLKLIRGNPGCRPINEHEPQPEAPPEPPEPPEFLERYAAEEWRRSAAFLLRLRLLTEADLKMLEAYCVSYGRWREAEEALARVRDRDPVMLGLLTKTKDGEMLESPLIRISRKSCFEMMRYACEFGFSPASRTRISQPPGDGDANNPFRGLIG